MKEDQIDRVIGIVTFTPEYVRLTKPANLFRDTSISIDENDLTLQVPVIAFDNQGAFVRLVLYRKDKKPVDVWVPTYAVLCFIHLWSPEQARRFGFEVSEN